MKLVSGSEQRRRDTPPRSASALCEDAASDLEAALLRFDQWGVRIPNGGRLDEARRMLRNTAAKNEFPRDRDDLLRVTNAIILANDFADIAGYLDLPLTPESLRALNQAVKGSLHQAGTTRAPYQAQSELWAQAVLSRGGLQPFASTPRIGRSLPDYLVEVGSITYGVEVKRPETRASVVANLAKARDQLNSYGVKGVIIMDLTDCLPPQEPLTADGTIDQLNALVLREVWGSRAYNAGYKGVMVLVVVARGIEVERQPSLLHVVHYSASFHFGGRVGSLHFIHGDQLSRKIKIGLATIEGSGHQETGWNRSMKEAGDWLV
jgi:hypothetical protein